MHQNGENAFKGGFKTFFLRVNVMTTKNEKTRLNAFKSL
jgi:hypothetical protein